jgi:hypothetical protein
MDIGGVEYSEGSRCIEDGPVAKSRYFFTPQPSPSGARLNSLHAVKIQGSRVKNQESGINAPRFVCYFEWRLLS